MENVEQYADFTKQRNWDAICKLNGIELDNFGTKKELKVLGNYLSDNEVVFALTSGMSGKAINSESTDIGTSTWLVVLTNERFLFVNHAFMTKSVDTQTIRHDRVQAVSASQGWVYGKIMVDIGSRTISVDNCFKSTVPVMAELANKILAERDKARTSSSNNNSSSESILDKLEKLGGLLQSGVLSQSEFDAAKAKLLASM